MQGARCKLNLNLNVCVQHGRSPDLAEVPTQEKKHAFYGIYQSNMRLMTCLVSRQPSGGREPVGALKQARVRHATGKKHFHLPKYGNTVNRIQG